MQIICELIGGTDLARDLTVQALENGKMVVTANKALLCEYGNQILRAARRSGGHIFFEASVAGAFPSSNRSGRLGGQPVPTIHGILNGTCNYSSPACRMRENGLKKFWPRPRNSVLPRRMKDWTWMASTPPQAGILTFLAHGKWIPMEEMLIDGIREVTAEDMRAADTMGYRIKHLASVVSDFERNSVL